MCVACSTGSVSSSGSAVLQRLENPERCQSKTSRHLSEVQSPEGTDRQESLVRTRCCLLSMLTSLAPCGSCSAASGSFSNPSSLSSQVSRCVSFSTLRIMTRREKTLQASFFCGFFFYYYFTPRMSSNFASPEIQEEL